MTLARLREALAVVLHQLDARLAADAEQDRRRAARKTELEVIGELADEYPLTQTDIFDAPAVFAGAPRRTED